MEPPKSKPILRKGPKLLGPKRSVQFSKGRYLKPHENSGKKGSIPRCKKSAIVGKERSREEEKGSTPTVNTFFLLAFFVSFFGVTVLK